MEAAADPSLVRDQARIYGEDVGDIIEGDRFVWHDFTSFLHAYDKAASLFRTRQDYARLIETYLTGLAADRTIYSEIFISPDHAKSAGLDPEAYVEGLAEGIEAARERTGIECRMIVVGIRHLGARAVDEAARFAVSMGHPLITGFGMAGEERFGEIAAFAPAFDRAREAGLSLTVHAGELAGPDSVRGALDWIRPSRVGHGVRAVEDAALVERMAAEKVVLETCPGSNVALGIYPDFARHPFPELLKAGVRLTVSSDDPPYFATSLSGEYAIAERHFGLDEDGLVSLTRNAIEAAFVDEATRGQLLARLDAAQCRTNTGDRR